MIALVTGGSRGIGAATVRELCAQGFRVLFTYNTGAQPAQDLCAELGGNAVAVHCDLSNSDALPAVVEECVARFGRIDVLVNNAAIYDANPFFGNDFDAWRRGWARTFAVNVFGTADVTYLVLQQMRKQGGGKIVNVISRSAHRGEPGFADYGASKAAIGNLTKSIARSCAADGIFAIAVAPGFIETEMAAAELIRRRSEIQAEIPSGRVGTAEEVARVIAFFAGTAGDYANGTTIDLNGGSYVR